MSGHPREVQWYLAKYIPDLERNEPRNVGLIVRPSDGMLKWRFLDKATIEALYGSSDDYQAQVEKWTATLEKHQEKCLIWIIKRSKKTPQFYVEMAGGRLVAGRIDMDAFFERLVL